MIGHDDGKDVGLQRNDIKDCCYLPLGKLTTWLLVIDENRNMAEGNDLKNPCAAAMK